MEGAPNDGTSADPAMTPIERQMQVIATSIQDLARETSRQNQEGGEVERTLPRSRHRAESAGSSAPPSQHKTAKTNRSSKQPERPDRSSKQPERQDRPDHSSRQPDRPARLRAKAARNLDNLVHRADSPFIPSIADFPLPSRFKVPLLENFDGTKDPFDYLEAFKTIMQLQAVPEEVMCRAFPLGLRGSARVWFNKLESESIGSFVQLSHAFIDHFIGSQRRGRPPTHLLSVKQMEGESLRAFVHRFNEEAMKIDRPKEDVTVTAFMAGLRKGDFLYELCKDPPETMSELMYEATKHMNAEDALEAMDDPPPKRRKETEDRKPEPAKQKIQDDLSLRWPGKIRSDPNSRPKNLYCRFHKDHGHLTKECVTLKEQVETLIRQGKLQKYVNRPAKPPAQREQVHNIMVVQRPPKNVRLDDQIISFSEEDARGTHQPHDDALVITVNIAGFTTRRVMVDNGSSADILYLPALPANAARQGQTAPHGCTTRRDSQVTSHEDMPGINPSIISHKLNVDPSLRLVKQKRRVFAPERNNAIMEEVDKLLAANFIREVFYPDWLANVVMVKKSTGKWRMCVDFTDLNKACPKDSFPLPRIDQLVDSTAGHKLLTFMDAFSGYNQIVLDESDQEKTSFITSRGLFCYKVMPFGLKNAGATYQRLMNRMFHDQIGRNVEVYIDDMLVKSKEEDGHLDNLRETFETLRKYQMKLNPSNQEEDLLKRFGLANAKAYGTPMSPSTKLDKDEKGKPVDVKLYRGDIELEFVSTDSQWADILTKPLIEERFCTIRREIGMARYVDIK
uniref:Reverse transcriptase domain-containing protein n=1 Tax=Fagus sylvatica TaxID=28930 RepID=A0A2N9I2V6_FAGSY